VEDWAELDLDGQSLHWVSPVVFNGRVTAAGEVFLVRGTAAADIETSCARCLSPVRVSIKADVDERFRMASHGSSTNSASDQDDEDDDWYQEDVQEFRGLTIHLDDVVLENLLVSMPVKVLCREGCQGLCPQCGKDLNEGKCDCAIDDINPRMAQLGLLLNGRG
jgi:uncharacterized protein